MSFSIQMTTLSNGFRIITDFIPHVESVSLGIWIGKGSRDEVLANNGVAHFLEHMAFKGTSKRSCFEISQAIEAVGGYLNAYTSRETTAYYARVLKEDVGLAVDILGDIVQNSVFDPAEIEKEREVILQELYQAIDTPDDIVFDYFQETAFPNQPLGRTILGSEASIKSITQDTLRSFMDAQYGPSKMVFAAAGNVSHETIVDLVNTHFDLKSKPLQQHIESTFYKGGIFKQDKKLEQAQLIVGFEGISLHDPDFYTSSVYCTILGGGMSSRLFQEIREKKGLAYSIYAFNSSYRDAGLFGIYAGTSSDKIQEVYDIVGLEMNKSTYSITSEELSRAKAQIKAGILMGLENTSSRAKKLAHHILMFDRSIDITETVRKIDSITLDLAQGYGKKLLSGPMTVASLGPISEFCPKL